jgi:Zn-dependent peptidase ImmA (M78 family)
LSSEPFEEKQCEELLIRNCTFPAATIEGGFKTLQNEFKPKVVWLILNGKPEEALMLLAKNYNVVVPKLKVGLPKGRVTKAYGCYSPSNETISVLNSDVIQNPFVILHEFYHHLRTSIDKQHKGTEKNADRFALEFLASYRSTDSVRN